MSLDQTIQVLNKSVLVAHSWPELGGEFDLLDEHEPDVPRQPAVNELVINDGETLRYPNLRSAVIYIGCAFGPDGLQGRLNTHRTESIQCRKEADSEKDEQKLFPPRYEWVNAAGGVVVFSVAPSGGRKEAEWMESLLLTAFEYRHYTLPIANGQHGVRYRGGEDLGRDSDLPIPSTGAF